MSKSIPNIITDWVNSMNNTFTATSILNGVMTVPCTKWAVVNGHVEISGTKYAITGISGNEITTNSSITNASEFSYNLVKPFDIYGTPRQVNVERGIKRRNDITVTPVFFLFDPTEEQFNDILSAVEREAEVRIAIMHNYKKEDFTADIYNDSINAMRFFAEEFIEWVKKQTSEVKAEDITYRITGYSKYGQVIDKSGSIENIFNEELSGVEIRITLPLWKQDKNCEC